MSQQPNRFVRLCRHALLFVWICGLGACAPADKTPEGAVREWLAASASGDTARVYSLLAPVTQEKLKKMADLAIAQTGGRQQIAPEQLLATSVNPPRHELSRVETEIIDENKANVTLLSKDNAKEIIKMRRVNGRWRLILPIPDR